MLLTTSVMRLFSIVFLAFFLCQCVQTADSRPITSAPRASKQYSLSSAEYLNLAGNEKGSAKQTLLINAALRAVDDGRWRQAQGILAQTSELTAMQLQQKQILLAKIEAAREHYRPALSLLASLREIQSLPMPWPACYHEVLAQVYAPLGQKKEAISERITLDSLLTEETRRQENRRALWSELIRFPLAELQTLAAETHNSAEQGWVQLVLIAKNKNGNAQAMIKAIEHWQNTFPNHAANHLLPDPLYLVEQKMHPDPQLIALLLPLSGALAGPGNAVKDGFMSAAKDNSTVKVKIYDTGKEPAEKLYAQAITEGADYVVGPLSKKDAAAVAAIDNPVPTLLLNEVDFARQNNTLQFGLSPGNEAAQVALKASHQGYQRALVIAPEGLWGKEVTAAFSRQWETGGGQVIDRIIYKNNADLARDIREGLHISKSEQREKKIKGLLGEKIQTRPARRNDIDMIFLLAYPGKARQIMPLLKYYYAGDLPVYATSTVYSGSINSMKDKDLDGIIFCDMLWVFNTRMANKPWPEQFNSYSRLYALGIDSFNLATALNRLLIFPILSFSDKNGLLYLTRANQIARMPEWGRFKAGQAAVLG